MINSLHWTLEISVPKSKDKMIETKASLYLYEDKYRVCFKNNKQIYYFELQADTTDNEQYLKTLSELYFNTNRNELDIVKCIRCFKWNVVSGQFCERCKKAIASDPIETSKNIILDIET